LKNYLNFGDFLDLAIKVKEKGIGFFLSKFTPNSIERTKAAFNASFVSPNWWIIPAIKNRWNFKISGQEDKTYEEFLVDFLPLKNGEKRSLLSIGCGNGNHSMKLAELGWCTEVLGIDLATLSIAEANKSAKRKGLSQCNYQARNVLTTTFDRTYDVVLFHSSLHHFDNMNQFLLETVAPLLSTNGLLVVFEYVGPNRLQWTKEQLEKSNELLRSIPQAMRTRLDGSIKRKIYRPGLWRMILSDPSEAVDSAVIRSALDKHFNPIVVKSKGGNLLHLILKDIAHHFVDDKVETKRILQELFEAEDAFLQKHESDFIFGVYQKRP
jgi:SAM-dependent methyltransferase